MRWTAVERDVFLAQLNEFLDVFYTEEDAAARQRLIEDAPPFLGVERDDAVVGAVAEHLARRWGLRIPGWAAGDDRDVAVPWFAGAMGDAFAPLYLAESPIAFRRRRIFVEAEPLRRARMPRVTGAVTAASPPGSSRTRSP